MVERDSEGRVSGISLPTVMQMVEMDKTTCTLNVQRDDTFARLHFVRGELVDAETGGLKGTDAAYEIVGWGNAEVEIVSYVNSRPRRIDRPLTAILLDVSKLADEQRRTAPMPSNVLTANWGGAKAETAKEGRVNTLHQALEAFREEVPEFVSTDIVNVESGLSIGGGSLDPDFDASVASASYAEVVKSNNRALDLIGLGGESTEDILVTTEKIYLLIRMLGVGYYHVLAVGKKGNLGLARAIMKKYEPKLLAAIGDLS